MTKREAIELFGRAASQYDLARALGMTTRQAISKWPDKLARDQSDRVLGAALRLRRRIPRDLLARIRASSPV